jgi:hypothetical protein
VTTTLLRSARSTLALLAPVALAALLAACGAGDEAPAGPADAATVADSVRVPADAFRARIMNATDSLAARLDTLGARARRLDAPADAPMQARVEDLHERLRGLRSGLREDVPGTPAARNEVWRRYNDLARDLDEMLLRTTPSREAFLAAVGVRLERQRAHLDTLVRRVDATPPALRPGLPTDLDRLMNQHQTLADVAGRARAGRGLSFDEQRDLLSLQLASLSAQLRTLERTLRRAEEDRG